MQEQVAKVGSSKNYKSEQKLLMTATTMINMAGTVTETVVAAPAVVVMVRVMMVVVTMMVTPTPNFITKLPSAR